MSGAHNAPTLSVLLPVYNAERYVAAAVESVLGQTFQDFELLALDDGSTDNSLAILRRYEAADRRMRVITRENRGLVPTLNDLIVAARAEYLARMDADDISVPDRFEKQLKFLESNPHCVVVGGFVERINEIGQRIGMYPSPLQHEEIDTDHLRGIVSFCHATTIFRKSTVLAAGGYRENYKHAEDLDLWLRVAELGQIANIPHVVYQYRMHAGSVSEAQGRAQIEAKRRACESAWQRRGIEGKFEAAELWRPGSDITSRHQFALQYGWTAWSNGHRDTWWTYARQALQLRPLSLASWRLFVWGALRKPPARPQTPVNRLNPSS